MAMLKIPTGDNDVSPSSDMAPSFQTFVRRTPSPHNQKPLPPTPSSSSIAAFGDQSPSSSTYSRTQADWPLDSATAKGRGRQTLTSFLLDDEDDHDWQTIAPHSVAVHSPSSHDPYTMSITEYASEDRSSFVSSNSHSSLDHSHNRSRSRSISPDRSRPSRSLSRGRCVRRSPSAHASRSPTTSARMRRASSGSLTGKPTTTKINNSEAYDEVYRSLLPTHINERTPINVAPPRPARVPELHLLPQPLFHSPWQSSTERKKEFLPYRASPHGTYKPQAAQLANTASMEISWPIERPNLTTITDLSRQISQIRSPVKAHDESSGSLLGRFASPSGTRGRRVRGMGRAGSGLSSGGATGSSGSGNNRTLTEAEQRLSAKIQLAKSKLTEVIGQARKTKDEKRREDLIRSIRVVRDPR